MNRSIALALLLTSCAPESSYTMLPPTGTSTKSVTSGLVAAFDVALCSAEDITPEARETFDLLSSTSSSTASKIFGGLLHGLSALGHGVACYMKNTATQRAQAEGEVASARASDLETIQARSTTCDPASQGYNKDLCGRDPRKMAAFLLIDQSRRGTIKISEPSPGQDK